MKRTTTTRNPRKGTASAAAVEQTGSVEKAAAVASAKDFPALTPDAFKLWKDNVLDVQGRFGWDDFVIVSENRGHSLTLAEYNEMHGVDPDAPEQETCSYLVGTAHACTRTFTPTRSVVVTDEGTFKTDERSVTADNPTGIVYRGNYVRVWGEAERKLVAKPFDGGHTGAVRAALKRNRNVSVPAQSYVQAQLSATAINAKNAEKRQARSEERQLLDEQFGDKRGERFASRPRLARQGRRNRGDE